MRGSQDLKPGYLTGKPTALPVAALANDQQQKWIPSRFSQPPNQGASRVCKLPQKALDGNGLDHLWLRVK